MSSPSNPPTNPPIVARAFRRVKALMIAKPAVFLLAAGIAAAAITVSYTTSTTVTSGVTPPPIQWLAGTDAGPSSLSDFVSAYSISTNKTYATFTVKGVPEATLTVGSLFRLTNVDDAAHDVTLSTSQITNAYVTGYTIQMLDGSTDKGTLALTGASPSLTFTLPAGSTYTGKLTLTLASGAGANNVALTNAVALSFT